MDNSYLIQKNQKKLRTGYTTGSCATAAAKAATHMLLTGELISQVTVTTPKGIILYLDVEHIEKTENFVSCAVKKDSGDDPDVTNGIYIYAGVEKRKGSDIIIDGGEGVARVTKKGLEQEIGSAAINKVPLKMIQEAVREEMRQSKYQEGVLVLISVPEGASLAEKTFNPRLGLEGGISILGTSGIVEPMSEKALLDTIFLEMKMLKAQEHNWCYIVPGNYGSDFLAKSLGYDKELAVKCSNFIGETIDYAITLEMKGILIIGHVGKLIKLAAGIMNTHSRQADARMEILASHAAINGAKSAVVLQLMECLTTREAIRILNQEQLLCPTMDSIMKKIELHLKRRGGTKLQIEALMFSDDQKILGRTRECESLLQRIQGEE